MTNNIRIRKSTLDVILLVLTFYEITIIPHLLFIAFKYCVLIYLFFKNIQFAKNNKVISVVIFIYGLSSVIPTLLNGMPINTLVASCFVGLQVFDIYSTFDKFLNKNAYNKLVKTIFFTFLILLVINDVLMLALNYNFNSSATNYFIGNKFVLTYAHCWLIALGFIVYDIYNHRFSAKVCNLIVLTIICFVSILCILKVECSTGIVAIILMLGLIVIPGKLKQIVMYPHILLAGTGIINFLIFGSYRIFENKYVLDFITNTIGETSTLNGRTQIWNIIFYYIIKKPIFGYGYYNSIILDTLGYGNAQNGVLKILLDTGILGLLSFGFLIYFSLKNESKTQISSIFSVYAFFVAMLAASLVEISLNHMVVIASLALIYNFEKEKCKSHTKKFDLV